jgi:hypothetical protein
MPPLPRPERDGRRTVMRWQIVPHAAHDGRRRPRPGMPRGSEFRKRARRVDQDYTTTKEESLSSLSLVYVNKDYCIDEVTGQRR